MQRGQGASGRSSPFATKPVQTGRSWGSLILNWLVVIGIIVLLGWSLLVKSPPKIIATTYVYRSAAAYTDFAASQMSGLKNTNKLTFDDQSLVNSLEHQFPEVAGGSVQFSPFSQELTLHITIATPAFFISDGTASYILDSGGLVVAKSTDFPQVKNLLLLSDQSGFKLRVGQPALGTSAIGFINTVVAQARHAKAPIASLTLPAGGEEVDLRTTDQPYFVKFYLGGDALNQAGQWLAARHDFAQNHLAPNSYLDVRVAGRVFYK